MGFTFVNILVLIVTAYYIATGPVHAAENAVKVGRQLNSEEQKDNAKRNLFLLLFSLRGSPVHYDFVRGLNQIDIVFSDSRDVLNAWHIHFASLETKGLVNELEIWERQRINLLSAMAVSLGYPTLQQTDILAHYFPEGHQNQIVSDYQYRELKVKLYNSAIETNRLLMLQIKNNLGLIGDDSEENQQ